MCITLVVKAAKSIFLNHELFYINRFNIHTIKKTFTNEQNVSLYIYIKLINPNDGNLMIMILKYLRKIVHKFCESLR